MKKSILFTFILAIGGLSPLSAQTLTDFSTGGTNPLLATDLSAPWVVAVNSTITSGGLTLTSAPNYAGGISDVLTAPVPVSNITSQFLTLTANLQLQPTINNFEIIVYDASFNDYRAYNFVWSEFNNAIPIAFSGTYDAADSSGTTFTGDVGGFQLAVGGTALDAAPNVSATLTQLAFTATAVPEPSTYAMFGFGLFMLYFVYRRKAKAQTVRA